MKWFNADRGYGFIALANGGKDRFRHCDQLTHTAALNAYTPDIGFLEAVLGIDARDQRIARTEAAFYQSLMRLSLRDPTAKRDVTLVVMDRGVAEWLVQWFTPETQVEVAGIDGGTVARKAGPGRPAKGTAADHSVSSAGVTGGGGNAP